MSDVPSYQGWRNVPHGLLSKTQLGDLDFPRIPDGPVRAYVHTVDWRGRKDTVPLYRLSESVPSKATAVVLESARARSHGGRRCGDCGAFPDLPPRGSVEGDPARRCNACHHIARLRQAQDDTRVKRVEAVKWARDVLALAGTLLPVYVVHVEEILRPKTPSGRQDRKPIAYRIEAVDGSGAAVVNTTVRATLSRVKAMPTDAVEPAAVADQLRPIAAAETVVTWDTYTMAPIRRLLDVPAPRNWYGGNPNRLDLRALHWRGDIDPYTADLRWPIHPGRADRMWLLLKRMAETEV